jgi:hypothetical protein
MTNLAMSAVPAVESLMMDPLPRGAEAEGTLFARVTSPVRHLRFRFSRGAR